MKKGIITLFLTLIAASSLFAQHSIQLDDGAGHYSILKSQSTNPFDVFLLPAGGGTLLTTGSLSGAVWLTAGNNLTGGLPTTPNEILGSLNNFDVVMKANGVEKMRLVSGDGINMTANLSAIRGVPYLWPAANATGVLSNDGVGNLSWTNSGVVTNATGTAPITVNGDNIAHSGAITIALTQGSLTSTGSSITVTGTGKTVAANINADLNLAHSNNWTAQQTITLANGFVYVDGNQALNKVLISDVAGRASWSTLGTSSITPGANNTFMTTNNAGVVGWTGFNRNASLVGDGITTALGLNLGNANTWTATQTFPAGSLTNAELANSAINFTYGTGISGPASITLGGTGAFSNTGVTSLAFTGGTLYSNIASATGAVTLAPALNTQANNTVFAGPSSGGPLAPTFRALVLSDLPLTATITVNGGTGLGVVGSPVSLGGTLTLSNTGVTSNIAGTGISVSGPTGAVTIGNTGILGITGSGAGINVTAGQNPVVTNTGVTSLAFTGGTLYGNIASATGAVTLAPALNTQTANTFFAGPTTAGPTAPTFRAMVSADIPAGIINNTSLANSTIGLSSAGSLTVTGSPIALGGAGTVNLNVANPNSWTGTQTFGGVAYSPLTQAVLAANTDNYALSASNSYFRISSSAPVNLTGITGGAAGRIMILQNVGANVITLKSQTTSAAANQFDLPGGADILMAPKSVVSLIYDSTLGFWEVVSTN